MTKLEKRISDIADATGNNVYVGRKANGDWFAGCHDIVEWEGGTPMQALDSVVNTLRIKAESEVVKLTSARSTLESLMGL